MYSLNRLILIDSYKAGTLQEIRLNGHTNLNGVNGAGKTTLLRLIPLFFGERPGRLVPQSRVTDSFAKHYLPNESSYIIFEYQRQTQTCMALIYASPNEEGLCYRFVDKGFDADDFLEKRSDDSLYPISCRDLGRHFAKRRIRCSNQITACNEYRTVIQNLPQKKGKELRDLIARYSFCDGSSGRRLKDIEKIVSGMLMRSTDFADLREMLVNCIDENRESIALEVQMETLTSWHKEYHAFQAAENERAQVGTLNRLENELLQTESDLGVLQQRLQFLSNRNQQDKHQQQAEQSTSSQQFETLKADWNKREQALNSELSSIKAELTQAERQKQILEDEWQNWENQAIQDKKQLYERLSSIAENLAREQENRTELMAHVQDIDDKFKRLKAEAEQYFDRQQHSLELQIQTTKQQATEQQNSVRQETQRQKDFLREHSQQEQDKINHAVGDLRQQLGMLNGKMAEIQPDAALLESREFKLAQQEEFLQQKRAAEEELKKIEGEIHKNQAAIDKVFSEKQKRGEDKQNLAAAMAHLQQQLDADSATLLGFLREQQPDWVNNIAKIIHPPLLLRDDLEPTLTSQHQSFYGLGLNLEVLQADQAADEEQIRARLYEADHKLKQLHLLELHSDEQLASLDKTSVSLKKQRQAADLKLGQIQKQLLALAEELKSLKQQIERSKKDKKARLEQEKSVLEGQIVQHRSHLSHLQQHLQTTLDNLTQALAQQIQQLNQAVEIQIKQIQNAISVVGQQKSQELTKLEQQRQRCLTERKVDTETLLDLEHKIARLKIEVAAAENARQVVKDHQHWLKSKWAYYQDWLDKVRNYASQQQSLTAQLASEQDNYARQDLALLEKLKQLEAAIKKFDRDLAAIERLLEDLKNYPKHAVTEVSFDPSHTLLLLQNDYRNLTTQHKTLRKELSQLMSHFKRVLTRFPETHPARYYASVENEVGIDGDDSVWLKHIQTWYEKDSADNKRWLVMQALNFGSAIRNYQQALERFDRGIDSLSRRLAANIDTNIKFEKIESIQGRLSSKVMTLGYWEQIVKFTQTFDDWHRVGEGQLPDREFAEMVRQVSEQLQGKGRVEMKLVNLLELEIIVSENGRSKRATHAEELRQISSHGLSYLILCVFFIALVNMIRKDQPINIIWPMDELKELHQMNIDLLVEILSKNKITLLSAFPDPDPDVLRLFKNRYQVVGQRELLEMDIDEDYLEALSETTQGNTDV